MDRQLRECASSLSTTQHTRQDSVREGHSPLVVTCLLSVWVFHQTSGCLVAWEILAKGLLSQHRATLHHNRSVLSQTGQLLSLTIFSKPSTSACTSTCKPDTTGQLLKDASDNCISLVDTGRAPKSHLAITKVGLQLGQTKCEKHMPPHKVPASPFWY